MSSSRRVIALILFSSLFSSIVSVAGCSRQGEGERCALLNGNADCDHDDLICTAASTLRGGEDLVDRCCLHPETNPTDSRCERRTTAGDGDGDNGEGGGGGIGGSDPGEGDDGIGTGCQWTSDCAKNLVCGPNAECMLECNTDRDCPDGKTCNDVQVCVAKE